MLHRRSMVGAWLEAGVAAGASCPRTPSESPFPKRSSANASIALRRITAGKIAENQHAVGSATIWAIDPSSAAHEVVPPLPVNQPGSLRRLRICLAASTPGGRVTLALAGVPSLTGNLRQLVSLVNLYSGQCRGWLLPPPRQPRQWDMMGLRRLVP